MKYLTGDTMKTISNVAAGLIIALGAAMCCAEVRVEESTVTIPTYAPGPYDKNPIFYTGRVYQGAQGSTAIASKS